MNQEQVKRKFGFKWLAFGILAIGFAVAFYFSRDWLTFEQLAAKESYLRELQTQNPWGAVLIAILIYVVATGFSLPGAAILSLSYGWYFGFWQGLLIVSFSSTTGATAAFLLSRYFVGESVQKHFAKQLTSFNENFQREGGWYLFTLRLVPLFPFFVVNLLMGLTKIRISTFWVISQIGMLPATIVIVFAGSEISLQELAEKGFAGISWKMLAAFAALGLLPLLIRKMVNWLRRPRLSRD